MTNIPISHPRYKSLLIREKLVRGFDIGLVAKEGLLAQGRGEAFDYLVGEKTKVFSKNAIKAAAAMLVSAKSPVISVNGNVAALCPKEIVELSKTLGAKIEVNLFYASKTRKAKIVNVLRKNGADKVFGTKPSSSVILSSLDSARRIVDKDGIMSADVVLVPLEDGDRTIALRKSGKKVITFDLNPLSRTSQTANITIVDNIVRALPLLTKECVRAKKKHKKELLEKLQLYDNKKNLSICIEEIQQNLLRRLKLA